MTDSFPRRQARTRRFTLGAPRGLTLSPDGDRVVFLRSRGGTDPVTCLWTLDLADRRRSAWSPTRSRSTRGGDEDLPPEERARRERSREQAGGIVGYATDRADDVGGVRAVRAAVRRRPRRRRGAAADRHARRRRSTRGPTRTAAASPTSAAGALHVHDLADGTTRDPRRARTGRRSPTASPTSSRPRRWSGCAATGGRPDGDALVVARVDDAPVQRWHIADPAHPDREPAVVAYPAAGTPNAQVSAEIITLDGRRTPIRVGPRSTSPTSSGTTTALLVVVQPRDQTALRALRVDPATGATTPRPRAHRPGLGRHRPRRARAHRARRPGDGRRRRRARGGCVVGGEPVTPPSLQVRGVLDVDGETVLFRRERDPGVGRAVDVGRRTGSSRLHARSAACTPAGCAAARSSSRRQDLDVDGTVTTVRRGGRDDRRSPSLRRAARAGPARHAAPRGRARACRPRCCCRRGTSRARRCRCSWTPTAARTPSASSPPATRT